MFVDKLLANKQRILRLPVPENALGFPSGAPGRSLFLSWVSRSGAYSV